MQINSCFFNISGISKDCWKWSQSSSQSNNYTIHLQNSVIKGYHQYHIRPPITDPLTQLIFDREYTNIHDKCACLVWIPDLDTFDASKHDMLTDDKRYLYLSDIVGLPVRHVPRGMTPIFRSVLDDGGSAYAQTFGDPVPSTQPWPE